MTKLQAETSIEFLKNIWSDCEFDNGALRYAVEALEMQIPKNPKTKKLITAISRDGKESYELEIICPNCHDELFIDYSYCPYCGQAIDMREVK